MQAPFLANSPLVPDNEQTNGQAPISAKQARVLLRNDLQKGHWGWFRKLSQALQPTRALPEQPNIRANELRIIILKCSRPNSSFSGQQHDGAHRRYLSAIKTLATVRKLLTPSPAPVEIATKLAGERSGLRLRQAHHDFDNRIGPQYYADDADKADQRGSFLWSRVWADKSASIQDLLSCLLFLSFDLVDSWLIGEEALLSDPEPLPLPSRPLLRLRHDSVPQTTGADDPISIAYSYHQQTKHQLDRYAQSLGYLDWANQPDPFRTALQRNSRKR